MYINHRTSLYNNSDDKTHTTTTTTTTTTTNNNNKHNNDNDKFNEYTNKHVPQPSRSGRRRGPSCGRRGCRRGPRAAVPPREFREPGFSHVSADLL